MKLKVITIATSCEDGLEKLIQSLQKHGYDFDILGIGTPWRGFYTKLKLLKEWCDNPGDYTHILFTDAYDTLFLDSIPDYNIAGILFSTEKGCWPDADKADKYPDHDSPWKYLNAGGYIGEVSLIRQILNENEFSEGVDDQRYWTDVFLSKRYNVRLDYHCLLFQSIAFDSGQLTIDNLRVYNGISGSCPVHIHGNGRTDMSAVYATQLKYSCIDEIRWADSIEYNKEIREQFDRALTQFSGLTRLRDFVENNAFGFGERSFYYMWYLILKELPFASKLLEIGVFRGQVLCLVKMIAQIQDKLLDVYGVTPLDSTDGHWTSDYEADIKRLHYELKQPYPTIFKGLSTDPEMISQADGEYDVVYIDGGHTYDVVKSDLENYPQMVKKGGFLVIDDCCNSFNMPFGYFAGIADVSLAVDEYLPPLTPNKDFEFLFNVVHNRVYRRL